MFKKLFKLHLAIFSILLITLTINAHAADEPDKTVQAEIQSIDVQTADGSTGILIRTNAKIAEYETNTVEATDSSPARMFVDLHNTAIKDSVASEIFIGTSVEKVRVASNTYGVRIVFDSSSKEMFNYAIDSTPNGLVVSIKEQPRDVTSSGPQITAVQQDSTIDELISTSVAELKNSDAGKVNATSGQDSLKDSFAISGYKSRLISIDIYKMDLHNVFRFFRDISGLNIIVDQGVNGTLTLSLNDVPWDFALDIILNLADLKKEERFNTIVIYPKKKNFKWPERTAVDNLEITADIQVLEEETLVVEQAAAQSADVLKAKDTLRIATNLEKAGDIEDAIAKYEEALSLWKTNSKISNKIATLYLVNLNNNAKAAYYAEESLKADPTNNRASMLAAISYANLQQNGRALKYFDQSISGNPPLKDALLSYAAFNENIDNLPAAIKVIDKYVAHYGNTADTLMSKARILDNLGRTDEATEQYKTLMASGFPVAPDLKKYINNRLAQ